MQFRPLQQLDIQRVAALETASLPVNEAINEEVIRSWQNVSSEFFTVACDATGEIVGFIKGTLISSQETIEKISDGSTLCIRSVVVDPTFRRQGIALEMLKHYVERVYSQQPQVSRIILISKCHLVELFIKAGFTVTGVSRSVHRQDNHLRLVYDCEAARQIPFVQVDAFTHEPFQGNPATVILLQPSTFHRKGVLEWMQQVAREKNLGATAFAAPRVRRTDDNVVEYDIKWFSPVVELTLCGHGTLSTAVALLDRSAVLSTQTIRFYNRTNVLVCRYEATVDHGFCVVMDFPCKPLTVLPVSTTPDVIAAALGIPRSGVLDTKLALNDIIVRLDKSVFPTLKPDYGCLAEIETGRFVVTTETSLDHSADFQSRFFAPRIGINEDPVTGSAHCGLESYWSRILGKSKLIGYQSTPDRGGFVEIDLEKSQPGRVLLKCHGVVVAHGVLTLSL
ncbi:Hypothetical protein PHPALM_18276 [Phytophthora palmivora]|uniref:N-acetyltransferase domain-containing protein n=1 Tax=Phytophthora palmivora TaxID=4796 RepID=A0A2P4XK71_9STRA|nr:Hypothetical protein PHPALM_18276 [Phytophthora palmivora]